ncbi:stage V sporulation protein AE [Mycoplasmatota bacterium]|nr:stage V sporulation protein AE [Mycoplasmatota bacterium]
MIYLYAFLVGGLICVIGQILIDRFKLTSAHITASFVVAGALLDSFDLYDKLIEFAGAGAQVPITSFGHSLLHGAMEKANEVGFLGIGMGMFDMTASGITAAIIFAFLVAVFFRPKG